MSVPHTTIEEATEHAFMNYHNTNGMVAGGDYIVCTNADTGEIREVQIRIKPSGSASVTILPRDYDPEKAAKELEEKMARRVAAREQANG
jgi:hypothetical protein